jgi:hypothetical protein
MVTVAVVWQLLLSITVTSNVPAHNPDRSSVVSPSPHKKVYGELPLDGVKFTDPSHAPGQVSSAPEIDAAGSGYTTMVSVVDVEQAPTVTVCVTV